ncbi:hypothetical protein okayama9524_06550 [Yersinia pseudotuberculosis]
MALQQANDKSSGTYLNHIYASHQDKDHYFNELNHIGDLAARCAVASSQKDIKTKSRHCSQQNGIR